MGGRERGHIERHSAGIGIIGHGNSTRAKFVRRVGMGDRLRSRMWHIGTRRRIRRRRRGDVT